MKKVMHFMFLSCFKATELIEKKLHFKLSYKEKLRLKVHKMMCDACTNFEKQSILIEKGVENLENRSPRDISSNLKDFEESIISKLKDQESKTV